MNEIINCGIEIEFLVENFLGLIQELLDNNFDFDIGATGALTSSTQIIIKPEYTVKGWEINIPPNMLYSDMEILCSIMNKYATFMNKCAMHIHIDIPENLTTDDFIRINKYYVYEQDQIILAAINRGTYADLNAYNIDNDNIVTNKFCRKYNLNIYPAYLKHNTIEHRIYKSTFDYASIIWCIEQTKNIIEKAMIYEPLELNDITIEGQVDTLTIPDENTTDESQNNDGETIIIE